MRILTGGKAHEPRNWLTWLDPKADSIVWMKEDVVDTSLFLYPEDPSSGFFKSRENKKMEGFTMYTLSKETWSTKVMVKVSVLSTIGMILMFFDMSVGFAPSFLKLDFSDLPALIGAFAMGPMAGVLVQLLKNLLSLLVEGSRTAGVGELSNFVVGSVLVYSAGFVYYGKKTFKNAVIGLALGVLSMTIVSTFSNYFVVFPIYAKVMPLDQIIEMGSKVNKYVVDYKSLILYAVVPFNILKGVAVSALTLLIYKRVSPILHK